ncbi:MAG: hypothetical protein JOZ16_01475 [Methylobacteriaceae bacterium]|nr:hypothetical protein [Methylobacteriaceae bacterium]
MPGANPWVRQAPPGNAARFLGGSPVAVFFRLLFASMLVGALLVWLDISPFQIFDNLRRLVDYVWSLGFDAVREIGRYIVAGAIIVVPVWLILRLMSFRAPR